MKRYPLLGLLIYGAANLTGALALLAPFLAPGVMESQAQGAPLLLALLVGLGFAAMLLEIQQDGMGAKFMALLGVLVALNAVLRFAETAIPGPGGFSPIFFLVIVAGYVFGGRFGFLLGALTILVSALITGGIGPWLPAQMLTTGWVGLSVVLLRSAARHPRIEIPLLVVFAAFWGLLYGVLINLWFWPFLAGLGAQGWERGLGLSETLQRYLLYYGATSLIWDLSRVAGNVALLLAFGKPTLRVLRRFQRRFDFIYRRAPVEDA